MSLVSPDPEPQQSQVRIEFQPYDSEIIAIEGVLERLSQAQGQSGVNLEGFRKEAIERFYDAGIRAQVKVYETSQQGVYWFEFVLVGRVSTEEFDPDRQVHEVTNDILGLGTKGVIKGGSGLLDALQHSHGGHSHHRH